jgi:thiazole synthase
VTVAIRRLPTNLKNDNTSFLNSLNWEKLWLLPNTAGSQTAEEAIRMAFLGHELACQLGQEDNFFVKLEVISDPKYLLPDPIGTLKAAEFLVKKGFTVLPYINADPMLALHLEDLGCATVMPLGSPIGSGQGLNNLANIQIIIENANIPVIIDAGIGTASEAAMSMEIGADAVLLNTAVAQSKKPSQMAEAMKLAVQSGRLAYLAGRMEKKYYATASSPLEQISKFND